MHQFIRKIKDAAPFISIRFDGNEPNEPSVPDGSFVRVYPNEETPDAVVDSWIDRYRKDGALAVVRMSKPKAIAPHVEVKKTDATAKDTRAIVDELISALPETVDRSQVRAVVFEALEKAGT